jgi:hypothetical protein
VTLERLVELVVRSLTVEHEVADVQRGHATTPDTALLVVTAFDGGRWKLTASADPWSRPAA